MCPPFFLLIFLPSYKMHTRLRQACLSRVVMEALLPSPPVRVLEAVLPVTVNFLMLELSGFGSFAPTFSCLRTNGRCC